MPTPILSQSGSPTRADIIFASEQTNVCRRTDRIFAFLMLMQWLAAVITAVMISPRTWAGEVSDIHIHVWAALVLGGIITVLPVWMALAYAGKPITRHIIAVSQMLMSALLIHLSGGRIETHFHVFGSLAFLAFYRDWRVLVTASLVVAIDHGLRGIFWPQSVYGALSVEPWRWLEHSGWVVFEDIFLIISIQQSLKASHDIARRQSDLEKVNELVEAEVAKRTGELQLEVNERKLAEANLEASNKRLHALSSDLEQSRDQAIQASRFKSEFLANMSHEIRTPLNAVVGMSDLLMRTPLTDEQRDFGMTINSSADLLLTIINDILDYSKIESGKLDLEVIEFDLVELIESAAELVSEKARSKQLSLSAYIDPNLPRILRGDPGRIRQILLNFLSNSIKFTDRGEIVISAITNSPPNADRLKVDFSVSDTGIGLSDAAKVRLFQPFTQADASITRKYGGTGLGLAISKRLVDLMHGNLTFKSVYGEGATFGFNLELEPCSKQEIAACSDVSDDTRILIVDGPPGAQQVLNSYISSWGMRCSTASDTDKAMLMLRHETAANDPYDIVFVSFEPDSRDSWHLLDEIRKCPPLAKTKLVLIGSSSDRNFGQQAMSNGFSAFLSLPVRQSRLMDCIMNLTRQLQGSEKSTTLVTNAAEARSQSAPEPCNLILVVEDNATNQKLALLQLRELGLAAHAVGNGLEALDAVARTQYSLILMDCQMPEMDGFQATSEIRKKEALTGRHTPIIAMTAHAMASDRLRCLGAGMDDFLSKPVSTKRLNEVLNKWLERPSMKPANHSSSEESGSKTKPKQKTIELDALFATYGEPAGRELVQEFRQNTEILIEKLTQAAGAPDKLALQQLSHELKGVSASIFAIELAELSRELEEMLEVENCSPKEIEHQLNSIQAAWNRVKTAVFERTELG